jgi:outer membrane protein
MMLRMRGLSTYLTVAIVFLIYGMSVSAQTEVNNGTGPHSLQECINYAIANQPLIKQSTIDESITGREINISLSGWLPQLSVDANLTHYLELPVSFLPDLNNPAGQKIKIQTGLFNTSTAEFSATQAIYSVDLMYAGKAVKDLRKRAIENVEKTKINTIITVSQSFYDVMLAIEEDELWNEEISRLERSSEDARRLYELGITDRIDFEQALISLNNARAQKRNSHEMIKSKYQVLKQSIGYPPDKDLVITFDSASYENSILTDTTRLLDFGNRIEFRQLQTELKLQDLQTGYYRWAFLPSVNAFYDYNYAYQNNNLPDLYKNGYPNSLTGLKLSLPVFQGTSRLQNLARSHLQHDRLSSELEYLKSTIYTEYTEAFSNYKSNIYALRISRENIVVAQEVFNTVSLQYNQGIKTFLNVIVAETDLRSAKLTYLSTLFRVLSSKLDLEAARGDIKE